MRGVSGISTAQKIFVAGRVAAQQMGRSRLLRVGWSALAASLGSVGRVLQLLWLQITGVFFVAFAVIGGLAFFREYRAWTADKVGPERALLALMFSLMFAYFGVSSFWRASRRS